MPLPIFDLWPLLWNVASRGPNWIYPRAYQGFSWEFTIYLDPVGLGWVKKLLLVFDQQWRIIKKRAPVKAKKTPPLQILAGAGGSGGEFHHLSSPAIWIGLRYYQQGKPFFREKTSKQWVEVVSLIPYLLFWHSKAQNYSFLCLWIHQSFQRTLPSFKEWPPYLEFSFFKPLKC